ncbi:MAG: hypothetical protein GX786_01040 [Clostridiales bacterium]|nr:hypothetical protein [Clostridiales bacterium]
MNYHYRILEGVTPGWSPGDPIHPPAHFIEKISESTSSDFGYATATTISAYITNVSTEAYQIDAAEVEVYLVYGNKEYILGSFFEQYVRKGTLTNWRMAASNETKSLLGKRKPDKICARVKKGYASFVVVKRDGELSTINLTINTVEDNTKSSVSINKASVEAGGEFVTTLKPFINTNRHKVTYRIGNKQAVSEIAAGTNSHHFTVPEDWCEAIPNYESGTLTATVETFDKSGRSLGSNTATVLMTVPIHVRPVATGVSAFPVDGIEKDGTVYYVQRKSKANIKTEGRGMYGSTISQCKIEWAGGSGTGSDYVSGVITQSGEVLFKVTVIDSRGRVSDEEVVAIAVVAYDAPKVIKAQLYRCNDQGEESQSGNRVYCLIDYQISNPKELNKDFSAVVRCRLDGGSYDLLEVPIENKKEVILGNSEKPISPAYAYEIIVELRDAVLGSFSFSYIIPNENVLFDFQEDRAALGRWATQENAFQLPEEWKPGTREGLMDVTGAVVTKPENINDLTFWRNQKGVTSAYVNVEGEGIVPERLGNLISSNVAKGAISQLFTGIITGKVWHRFANGAGWRGDAGLEGGKAWRRVLISNDTFLQSLNASLILENEQFPSLRLYSTLKNEQEVRLEGAGDSVSLHVQKMNDWSNRSGFQLKDLYTPLAKRLLLYETVNGNTNEFPIYHASNLHLEWGRVYLPAVAGSSTYMYKLNFKKHFNAPTLSFGIESGNGSNLVPVCTWLGAGTTANVTIYNKSSSASLWYNLHWVAMEGNI